MILVADSGSTKTDWVIIDKDKLTEFSTEGINPLFLEKEKVLKEITDNFPKHINFAEITEVYFYGPGCSSPERCFIVENPLRVLFVNAKIFVETDLLAAARALFQVEEGIACILGTGSNSGLYNGQEIVDNIRSTGYILGDEGSGANLGLELVKLFINKQLDKSSQLLFQKQYNLTIDAIIDKVYRQAYPNRFLAGFTPFVRQNMKDKSIKRMAEQSFSAFIDWHILPYQNSQNKPVAFVGSIAFYFQDLIKEIASKKGIKIVKINQQPILDLVRYHQTKNV